MFKTTLAPENTSLPFQTHSPCPLLWNVK